MFLISFINCKIEKKAKICAFTYLIFSKYLISNN